MAEIITCQCGGKLKVESAMAGKLVRCPKCSATLRVPAPKSPAAPSRNDDPFGSMGIPSSPSGPAPSFQNIPQPAAPSFGGPAQAPRTSSPKRPPSPYRWLWITLGVVGGGIAIVCLGCAGFLFMGVSRVREQIAMQQDLESGTIPPGEENKTLVEAKAGFKTKIVSRGEPAGPPDDPSGSDFQLVNYPSPVGELAAYLTRDPGDGKRHPAIVWITGGDCNSIGDVWSPQDRSNDQSASAFRKRGIVMMFPSQRGGNSNPGSREGFFGEVDDILAATDFLAKQPYVDPQQIYLGGHSTGGTMVMLVAASSDRYKATFSLGPVAVANQYGGEYIYCSPFDTEEVILRSPIRWMHCVKTPLYVMEGGTEGNWEAIEPMMRANKNPNIQFFKVDGHDHFTVIAPVTEKIAEQIVAGQVQINQAMLQGLR